FTTLTTPPPTSTLLPYTTLFRSEIPDHTTRVGNPPPRGLAGLRPLAVPSDAPGRRPLHAVSLDRSRHVGPDLGRSGPGPPRTVGDRKSTRLNSSHVSISYAVFCL